MCEADLILVLGSRFSDRATGDKARFANGARILHIDIDPAEIDKNIPCYNSLVGDVGGVLELLFERLSPRKNAAWWERIAQIRAESLLPRRSGLTPQLVIETVRRHAREDTVVATDVGQHQMWVAQTYRFSRPRTFLTSGGLGTMGFGLGAAIGACIGSGGRETVLFTGDGSFHMNLNELATAVSYRLPLRIFLINNGVLGMVYQWQHLFYENRFSCTQPERKTDFKALAEAFGAQGFVLSDAEDAEAIVSRAFACEGVALVDCSIAKNELVLPMIPPGGSMYDLILSSERGVSHE